MKNLSTIQKFNLINLQTESIQKMKNFLQVNSFFKSVLIAIVFVLSSFQLDASHIMGADITYRVINPTNGTYRFRLSGYRDCFGINFGGEQLRVRSQNGSSTVPMNLVSTQEVTPLCAPPDVAVKPTTNCPNGPIGLYKGVQRVIFEVDVTIGNNIGWAYVGWGSCCRNAIISTINNPSGTGAWVQALINTNLPALNSTLNSSTVFTSDPVPYWCKGVLSTYNHGSVDSFDKRYDTINGKVVVRDSLSYRLYAPFTAEAANANDAANFLNPSVSFIPPLNANNFLYTTNGVTLDPKSGSISCTPSVEHDAIMAMACIEWRAIPNPSGVGYTRVMAGYVCRDIQFTIRANCNPIEDPGVLSDSLQSSNFQNKYEVDVCGSKYTKIVFKMVGAPGESLKYRVIQNPSSSVINFLFKGKIVKANSVDTLFGTLTFDSTIGIGSDKFILEAYYCTSIGIKISKYYALTINYKPSVTLHKSFLYYCLGGKPVRSYARGGAPQYYWYAAGGGTAGIVGGELNDSTWVDLAPATTTTYIAHQKGWADSTKSCSNLDSVKVIVIPKFNYTLSPKVSNLCLHDTVKVILNTQISDTPYTFKWYDPTSGSLINSANNRRGTNIKNPRVVAVADATYIVDITSRFDCTLTDSIRVNLSGVRSVASGLSARAMICAGDTTMLSATVIPKTTGPSMFNCNVPLSTASLPPTGTPAQFPTVANPPSVGQAYPNPFSTLFSSGLSTSSRYVYKKSELVAAGMKAGIIKSLSVNLVSVAMGNFTNFEVRIGGTTSANASLYTPTYNVYGPAAYSAVNGWNKFIFPTCFDWDGNSNIVIETHCKTANAMLQSNQILTINSLASTEVAYKLSSFVDTTAENLSTGYTTSVGTNSKPQIKFEYGGVDSTQTSTLLATWTPTQFINPSPLTPPVPQNPKAIGKVTQYDSTFIATVGTAACYDTAMVKLRLTTFKIKGSVDKNVVCVTSIPTFNFNAVMTGGSAGATVQWTCNRADGGIVGAGNTAAMTAMPTGKGLYKFIATADDNPCLAIDTIYVTVNDSLTPNMMTTPPLCTSSTGTIQVIVPSGTTKSMYDFIWTPAAPITKDSLMSLAAGNYSCKIILKSDPGCSGTITSTLTPISITLTTTSTVEPIKCFGGTTDSMFVTASHAQSAGPYSYSWSPGGIANVQYNKPAGIYNIIATDTKTGCTGSKVINLTEPTKLQHSLVYITPVKCKGLQTGAIKASASGGTMGASYIYQWKSHEKLQTLPNFNELTPIYADSVTLYLSDINGCQDSGHFRIPEPTKGLTIDSMLPTDATTVGGADGRVRVQISGGVGAYNYKWQKSGSFTFTNHTNRGTKDTLMPVAKGIYKVTVQDINGCLTNDSAIVEDIRCSWNVALTTVNAACAGESTGQFNVSAIDSMNYLTNKIYTFKVYDKPLDSPNTAVKGTATVDNGGTLPYTTVANGNLTGFAKAYYYIRLQTDKGCDTNFGAFMDENKPIAITRDNNIPPSCKGVADGEIHISFTDPNGPFEINWDTVSAFQPITSPFSSKILLEGGHGFVIRNINLCTQPYNFVIDTPPGVTIMTTLDRIACHGFSNGTGKISYSLDSTRSGLNINPSTISYHGTSISTNKPGTNVNPADSNVAGLSANLPYKFTIQYTNSTNGNVCYTSETMSATEPDTLVLGLNVQKDMSCSYNLDGIISGILPLNQKGNGTPYSFKLEKIAMSLDSPNKNQDNIAFNYLDSGTYMMTVKDFKGCADTIRNIVINKPDSFMITLNAVDASCIDAFNGQVSVDQYIGRTSQNPIDYQYRWTRFNKLDNTTTNLNGYNSYSNVNLIGLSNYTVEAEDLGGCVASKTVSVDTQYVLRITGFTIDSAKCFGSADGVVTITNLHPFNSVSPLTTYTWNNTPGTNPMAPSIAGTYTLNLTDSTGLCHTSAIYTIEQPADIVIVGTTTDVVCYGDATGSAKANVVSGGTPPYHSKMWLTNPIQYTDSIVGVTAGTYSFTTRDQHNCLKAANFTIIQPPVPFVLSSTKKDITCFAAANGEINLTSTGGKPTYNYAWSPSTLPNQASQTNLTPGNYRVTITDLNGCSATLDNGVDITQPTQLQFVDIKLMDISCPHYNDGVIDISANGGTISANKQYEYSVNGGTDYFASNKFTGLVDGDYNVVVRDNNNCIIPRKVTIGAPEELFVTALRLDTPRTTDTITMGNTVPLTYSWANKSLISPTISNTLWNPSNALSCADCKSPFANPYITTKYDLEVRYHKNCLAKSTITIPVYAAMDFYMPSAFTPNGDGVNDNIMAYGNGIKKILFQVFDRWGEKVFESNHLTIGWDGIYKGSPMPTGVYSYNCEVEYLNGESKNKKGSITLIR